MHRLRTRVPSFLVIGMLAAGMAAVPAIHAAPPVAGTANGPAPNVPARPAAGAPHRPAVNIPVSNLADLTVDSITLSNPIKDGDKIGAESIFNITVKNAGKAASAESKIKITLTALTGSTAPAELSGAKTCRALAPGEICTFAWPGLSANTWPAGKYRLTVEADSDKMVAESNEQNNAKTFDFTVTGKTAAPITSKAAATDKIGITGKTEASHAPVKVPTEKLSIVGKTEASHAPVKVTAERLSIIGQPVAPLAPVKVATEKLTIIGQPQ